MVIDQFFLGGFEFQLVSPSPVVFAADGNSHYRSFASPPPPAAAPHARHTLRLFMGGQATESGWEFVTETPAWRLDARKKERRLSLARRPGQPTSPTLRFLKGADSSDLCVPANPVLPAGAAGNGPGRHPFRYPLDQMRLLYLLAEHRGFIMHAAGAVRNGDGVIFAGRSGAGKSTITRLLEAERPGTVLSDDRVIVRATDDALWVYGTPWPGDAQVAASACAPLRALCFLRHSAEDRLIKLNASEALHRLLEVVSVPWFDREAFPPVLDTCEDLARRVPAFDLCFRPTPAVLSLLGDVLALGI